VISIDPVNSNFFASGVGFVKISGANSLGVNNFNGKPSG
jgi:hypothetical protein